MPLAAPAQVAMVGDQCRPGVVLAVLAHVFMDLIHRLQGGRGPERICRSTTQSSSPRREFARFGAAPPAALGEIYKSFVNDEAMFAMLLLERPAVISFHFGLPPPAKIAALRAATIATTIQPTVAQVTGVRCAANSAPASANGSAKILRSEFDLGSYAPFVSDEVTLWFNLEAIKE